MLLLGANDLMKPQAILHLQMFTWEFAKAICGYVNGIGCKFANQSHPI